MSRITHPDECDCACHTMGGIHAFACCDGKCPICKRWIARGQMTEHVAKHNELSDMSQRVPEAPKPHTGDACPMIDLDAIRKRAAWHDAIVGEDRCKCTVACDDRRLLLAEIERLRATHPDSALLAPCRVAPSTKAGKRT